MIYKRLYDNDQRTHLTSSPRFQFSVFIAMIVLPTIILIFVLSPQGTCSPNSLPSGFVYLRDIIPEIQISLRYASEENFVGHVINGYLANVSIISQAAALALKKGQIFAKEKGYEFVIYDGYRPQKSVDRFVRWSEDSTDPQLKKSFYYPRVNKEDAFQLGYIARKSGHTRGSTLDLTLISIGTRVQHPLTPKQRQLNDNSTIFFLDDGTIDMGSSFDLFDEASHTNSTLVSRDSQERRLILKDLMTRSGFVNYDHEWWHYTLQNEPFPTTYFDFDISSSSTDILCK